MSGDSSADPQIKLTFGREMKFSALGFDHPNSLSWKHLERIYIKFFCFLLSSLFKRSRFQLALGKQDLAFDGDRRRQQGKSYRVVDLCNQRDDGHKDHSREKIAGFHRNRIVSQN